MEKNTISIEGQLRMQLNEYPSCFQTFDYIKMVGKKKLETILAKVKSERNQGGYRGLREDERDLNLLSYLSFAVGKYDDARQYNREVLEKNEHSISAIVSKAWFHLHNSEFSKTQEQCSRLETLKNHELEMKYAKAEHAYICTRLGMQLYKDAERLFNELLADFEDTEIPEYEICLWKFGLALIIKRQLNFFNVHAENLGSLDYETQRCNRMLELFRDVILLDGENIDIHKARAYVEIGGFLNMCVSRKQTNIINKEIVNSVCLESDFKVQVEFCYYRALELNGDDVFVLERTGKYFRLIGQFDLSIQLCNRALTKMETSTAHHHLALALKKKLEFDSKKKLEFDSKFKKVFVGSIGWQSKLIKSPKKPVPLPTDAIADILYHLQKSFELGENCSALYDKGLVLRAAAQYNEALDVFKTMFRNNACSLVTLSNAYEQSAFCLQDQLEASRMDVSGDEDRINLDIKEYLLRAIEIQCNIIVKQPSLKNCWSAFPTYKRLLEEGQYSMSNKKELGKLHQMVQDYSEAITCFIQVLQNETDNRRRASAHIDIAQACVDNGDYNDAIVHLKMFLCLPECGVTVDDSLYFNAHIEGGLQAWSTGEMVIAPLRIKNALDYRRTAIEVSNLRDDVEVHEQDESSQGERFDILVLSDPDSDTTGRTIHCLLVSLGLHTTLNDDNAAANLPRIEGLSKVIEKSTHCIIILGENIENMESIKLYANIVKDTYDTRHYGNIVVVKENNTVSVDTMFTGFTTMPYMQIESYTEDNKPWIKDLLWRLASGAAYEQT